MNELNDITFIIPVSIDSEDRYNNINYNVEYMKKMFNIDVFIFEYDTTKKFYDVSYNYMYFNDKWSKTKCINMSIKYIKTEYFSILDSDVFLTEKQLYTSIKAINEFSDMVIPYNGEILDVDRYHLDEFVKNFDIKVLIKNGKNRFDLNNYFGVGCCVFFKLSSFLNSGMMNENFDCWGCEDDEIYYRFLNLGYNVTRLRECGPIIHINHFRKENDSINSKTFEKNFKLMNEIRKMSYCEMKDYVKNNL